MLMDTQPSTLALLSQAKAAAAAAAAAKARARAGGAHVLHLRNLWAPDPYRMVRLGCGSRVLMLCIRCWVACDLNGPHELMVDVQSLSA